MARAFLGKESAYALMLMWLSFAPGIAPPLDYTYVHMQNKFQGSECVRTSGIPLSPLFTSIPGVLYDCSAESSPYHDSATLSPSEALRCYALASNPPASHGVCIATLRAGAHVIEKIVKIPAKCLRASLMNYVTR